MCSGQSEREVDMKRTAGLFFSIILVFVLISMVSPVCYGSDSGSTYVVKKGDTLWDISAKFLGDPNKWPELWERNRFLTNPNYIYPGLELMIEPPPPVEEEFVIYKVPEKSKEEKMEGGASTAEAKEKATSRKIYLTRKEVLTGGELVAGEPKKIGSIIETTEEKVAFSPGDKVYLDLSKDFEPGTYLGIYRVEGPVYVPGFRGKAFKNRYIGKVRVDGKYGNRYVGTIVELLEEALRTDYLEEEIPDVPEIEPRFVEDGLRGEVVTGSGGNYEFAERDVLYVKGGSRDGFEVGDVLNIYVPLDSLQKLTVSQVNRGLKPGEDFVFVGKAVIIKVNDFFSTIYVVDSVNSFNTPALVVRGKV